MPPEFQFTKNEENCQPSSDTDDNNGRASVEDPDDSKDHEPLLSNSELSGPGISNAGVVDKPYFYSNPEGS